MIFTFLSWQEWGAEGYELWCVQQHDVSNQENLPDESGQLNQHKTKIPEKMEDSENVSFGSKETSESKSANSHSSKNSETSVIQFSFIKSALTVNPCMVSLACHLLFWISYEKLVFNYEVIYLFLFFSVFIYKHTLKSNCHSSLMLRNFCLLTKYKLTLSH